MKQVLLWALPCARYIAYGEDAHACQEIMLGGREEGQQRFAISPRLLTDFVSTAVGKGWRVLIRDERERGEDSYHYHTLEDMKLTGG